MNVLIIGSGGREHAIAWKLAADPSDRTLFAAPGNPGIAQIAQCFPQIRAESADAPSTLLDLANHLEIDLTVVGPEAPLVNGIVDHFRAADRLIVGPTAQQARLEGSKVFAKQFFLEQNIPTARFQAATSPQEITRILDRSNYPVVIKADGLAAGKGVVIAKNRPEAQEAAAKLGPALVIEEFLTGEEVSFIVLSDGKSVLAFEPCQDHKAVLDGDQGPNTGGMGAYCDSRILTAEDRTAVLDRIILPTVQKTGFAGFLFAGLMMTPDGPKLLEFNVRLGDPETQTILHRMVADFGQLLRSAAEGNLSQQQLTWRPEPSVCVVMASQGYPATSHSGDLITGIAAAEAKGATVFQAGPHEGPHGLETAGGRVLGVTARGSNLPEAIANAYSAVNNISFPGAHFRSDIGAKGLVRWPNASIQ